MTVMFESYWGFIITFESISEAEQCEQRAGKHRLRPQLQQGQEKADLFLLNI